MTHHQSKIMLVTGGAGFIGANFIHYVLTEDPSLQIITIDKLTYAGSLQNLSQLPQANRHTFIQGDITDEGFLHQVFRDYPIDTVVHFAAESHVDRSIAEPAAFVQTNVLGTYALLETARRFWSSGDAAHGKRFHHISTDEVFGSLSEHEAPFTEHHPVKPRSPYSATKAASDHLVKAYHHTYGLPITLSHCSNNYGPFQHAEKFIPTVIRSCINWQPIPIYGNGKNVRDWLYVRDHCEGIWTILTRGIVGTTYNLGGNHEIDNLTLAKIICEQMDKLRPQKQPHESLISYVPDRLGHDFRYAMDTNFVKTTLSWQPRTNFYQGLQQTLAFYLGLNEDVYKDLHVLASIAKP